jgi:hypothetical protein
VIASGRATTGGTAVTTASLFPVPPGPATLILANNGTAATVYVGPGTNVTTSNGFPVPSGLVAPVVIPVYAGAAGATWSVACSAGTATLSWIVSDPSAGTGP